MSDEREKTPWEKLAEHADEAHAIDVNSEQGKVTLSYYCCLRVLSDAQIQLAARLVTDARQDLAREIDGLIESVSREWPKEKSGGNAAVSDVIALLETVGRLKP